MNKETLRAIDEAIDAICDLVDAPGTWSEKSTGFLDSLGKDGRWKFEEFLSWFNSEDKS